MTYDLNVFQIIGFLTLSGIILRSTLSIVGQNWVRTYHFLGTFILLPNIASNLDLRLNLSALSRCCIFL